MSELGTRETVLTDDREQCAGAQLSVIGYRDGDRTLGSCLLHHDMASAASHFHGHAYRSHSSLSGTASMRLSANGSRSSPA